MNGFKVRRVSLAVRFVWTCHQSTMADHSKVYVYRGEGAEDEDAGIALSTMKKHLDDNLYDVSYISPEDITEGSWLRNTALLILGGGYDLGFIRALGVKGLGQIRNFVHNGGAYLGICAGGYFGCESIEFDKGGPLEVCGERHLKFYPGCCIGPAFPGFQYNEQTGASAVSIDCRFPDTKTCSSQSLYSYFNGGGYFKPPINKISGENELQNNVDVLAVYTELKDKPAAMVRCKVGRGVAVLSGFHFEREYSSLDDADPLVTNIKTTLKTCKTEQLSCVRSVLKQLGMIVQKQIFI